MVVRNRRNVVPVVVSLWAKRCVVCRRLSQNQCTFCVRVRDAGFPLKKIKVKGRRRYSKRSLGQGHACATTFCLVSALPFTRPCPESHFRNLIVRLCRSDRRSLCKRGRGKEKREREREEALQPRVFFFQLVFRDRLSTDSARERLGSLPLRLSFVHWRESSSCEVARLV